MTACHLPAAALCAGAGRVIPLHGIVPQKQGPPEKRLFGRSPM
jgi:hypothetical protein